MVKEDHRFENNKIIIGENATENDYIVKNAKQTDIWFHLADFPSCHVIIDCSSEFPINKQMINYCANLVKENTKYKNIPKVKVNYTQIKNVKTTNIKGQVTLKGKILNVII